MFTFTCMERSNSVRSFATRCEDEIKPDPHSKDGHANTAASTGYPGLVSVRAPSFAGSRVLRPKLMAHYTKQPNWTPEVSLERSAIET